MIPVINQFLIIFQNHQKSHPTHHHQDWLPDYYIISRELTPVWRNVVPIGRQEKRRPETLTAEIPRGFLHLVATTTVSTGYSFNMEVGLPRCHHCYRHQLRLFMFAGQPAPPPHRLPWQHLGLDGTHPQLHGDHLHHHQHRHVDWQHCHLHHQKQCQRLDRTHSQVYYD